jgi:hypothetical protein
MVIDLILENAVVYDIVYKVDIKVGQHFTLVMDNPSEMDDVFANNDSVLSYNHSGSDINVDALIVGESKIRIFLGDTKVREILINVVNVVAHPAKALNTNFGMPIEK